MTTHSMVSLGRLLINIVDHVLTIKDMHYKACRGINKRSHHQGSQSGIHNKL